MPAAVAHQDPCSSCDIHQGSALSWLSQPGLLLQTALLGSRALSVAHSRSMLALAGVELLSFPAVGMGVVLGFYNKHSDDIFSFLLSRSYTGYLYFLCCHTGRGCVGS